MWSWAAPGEELSFGGLFEGVWSEMVGGVGVPSWTSGQVWNGGRGRVRLEQRRSSHLNSYCNIECNRRDFHQDFPSHFTNVKASILNKLGSCPVIWACKDWRNTRSLTSDWSSVYRWLLSMCWLNTSSFSPFCSGRSWLWPHRNTVARFLPSLSSASSFCLCTSRGYRVEN